MECDYNEYGEVIAEYFPVKPEKSLAIFLHSANSAEKGHIAQKVWTRVGQEIVQRAKGFLVENESYDTGALYNSTHAEIHNGSLQLLADARNPRSGYAYGGAIEYGHVLRNGTFFGAKPFLRPAIMLSINHIRGEFGNEIMQDYMAKNHGAGGIESGFMSFGIGSGNLGNIGQFGRWQTGSRFGGWQATTFKMAQRQTLKVRNLNLKGMESVNTKAMGGFSIRHYGKSVSDFM